MNLKLHWTSNAAVAASLAVWLGLNPAIADEMN